MTGLAQSQIPGMDGTGMEACLGRGQWSACVCEGLVRAHAQRDMRGDSGSCSGSRRGSAGAWLQVAGYSPVPSSAHTQRTQHKPGQGQRRSCWWWLAWRPMSQPNTIAVADTRTHLTARPSRSNLLRLVHLGECRCPVTPTTGQRYFLPSTPRRGRTQPT